MKFTEGAFRNWGYELAERRVRRDVAVSLGGLRRRARRQDPRSRTSSPTRFLQQILTRPAEYDVIATMNLNGDYLSDALAAQVGGIGIAPGRQHQLRHRPRHLRGHPRHGAEVRRTQDKVNPGSVILSGEMMFRYLGWTEAADLIITGMDGAIGDKIVTYDFARLMDGATEVGTSDFGRAVVERM